MRLNGNPVRWDTVSIVESGAGGQVTSHLILLLSAGDNVYVEASHTNGATRSTAGGIGTVIQHIEIVRVQ